MMYVDSVQQYLPVGNQLDSRGESSKGRAISPAPGVIPLLYGPRLATSPKQHTNTTRPPILVQAMQDILPHGTHPNLSSSWESVNRYIP